MQAESESFKKRPQQSKQRGGRPTAAQAGDVDRRILEAAQRLFLTQGYELTNCEQVVAEAGAGKASLYARYANKEELFTAVVHRSVNSLLTPAAPAADPVPLDGAVTERLRMAGNQILSHAMQPQVIALMRLVVTTAYRLPDLAKLTNSIGRDRGIQVVAAALAGSQASSTAAMSQATPTAAKFIELIFVPLQMRALLGDDLSSLVAESPRAIDDAVHLMSAAGWLDEWS